MSKVVYHGDGPATLEDYYVTCYYVTDVAWVDVDGCPVLNEFMREHVNDYWTVDDLNHCCDPDDLYVYFDVHSMNHLKEHLPVQALDEISKLIEVNDVEDCFAWFEDEFDYHTEVADYYGVTEAC